MILGNWIRIPSFVSILANSSGVNKRRPGRNVIGGFTTTIERSRPSYQKVSGRWSLFSRPLSAAVMPDYFAKRYMKSTFRGFNEGISSSLLTDSEREDRSSQP